MPATIPAEVHALLDVQIDLYRTALAPAPKSTTLAMLARLAVHFPDQRSKAEWKLIHEDYLTGLADVPDDIVAEAIGRYLRRGRFYPKLAELIAETQPLLDERRQELNFLLKLQEVETPQQRDQRVAREKRDAEERYAAKVEAECQAKPFLRIWHRWADRLRSSMYLHPWHRWLEQMVAQHGLEVVDAWHVQLAAELEREPFPNPDATYRRLMAIANDAIRSRSDHA